MRYYENNNKMRENNEGISFSVVIMFHVEKNIKVNHVMYKRL